MSSANKYATKDVQPSRAVLWRCNDGVAIYDQDSGKLQH